MYKPHTIEQYKVYRFSKAIPQPYAPPSRP